MKIDQEIMDVIGMLSRKVSRRYWSEGVEDLTQDGVVLILELLKKRPNADKEWLFKALHNFYASKRKKLRRYESRRVDEESIPEIEDISTKEEGEVPSLELELVEFLIKEGLSRKEILKHLETSDRTLYARLKSARE